MARPSLALKRFVELYVNGEEHTRGQWEVSANGSGLREMPDPNDPMVQRMIKEAQELGGEKPPVDELENLLEGGFEGIPWTELKNKLTNVIQSIASGKTQARAAQIQAIQLIIKKAEEEAKESEVVHNVLILPTRGTDATMKVDDEWIAKIMAMEAKDSDE